MKLPNNIFNFQMNSANWLSLVVPFGTNELNKMIHLKFIYLQKAAQWLSGRVLELKQMSCGFERHGPHCIMSLSKTRLSLLSTGSIQEDPSRHNWKLFDWDK